MKKVLTLLLIMLLSISMVACGSDSSSGSESQVSSNENNSTVEEPNEVTFEEITVVDNEECVIKITGIDESNMWGYTLKAYLENKSADKVYMFAVDNASVNGVKSDPLFATEVAAGKKANAEISFMDSNLEEVGDFTDIEIAFRVYDSEDWTAESAAAESVRIYPYGKDKASTYVREDLETDVVLVDNEHVKAVVTASDPDDMWGFTLNMYLENKTNNEVMFSIDDASVNGFMADPLFATSVPAGKCAFSSATWSALEDEGITTVEEIEFVLSVTNSDDWTAEPYAEEDVSLTITYN